MCKTIKLVKMISFEILFFSAIAVGFVMPFCEANILINTQIPKNKMYRVDLEIFKHVDRYYSVSRRAQVWEIFEEMDVKSDFNFFIDDDNINELKYYMKFIATNGYFYANNSLTLSYSMLYTKYKALFYAVNLLNIYKVKVKEFELWDKDDSINELLKKNKQRLLNIYLKLCQYFGWYAYTGNDVLQTVIEQKLQKIPCAVQPYIKFATSFNKFLNKLDEKIFKQIDYHISNKETIDLEKFWKIIYDDSVEDIKIINQYFTAVLLGVPENEDIRSNFISTVQKESIVKFVSDLSIMKGRDIEETYANFDNRDKKEIYETNVVNLMKLIEDKEMESVLGSSTELKNARKNHQYVVIQQSTSKEIYTCLKFNLRDHETLV